MLALYGSTDIHPQYCKCPACKKTGASVTLADDTPLSVRWRKVDPKIETAYIEAVYNQTVLPNRLDKDLWNEHYNRLHEHAQAGWGKRFSQPADLDEWNRFQNIEENLRSFAAHKQHRITEELRTIMSTPGITRAEYDRRADLVMKRHNRWLRAEVHAATMAAQSAESWREIERRAYLYPNLRYATAGDEKVRQDHRALNGIIRPIKDSFWDVYYPPNGWLCRCKTVQTDAAPTAPREFDFRPPPGFDHNPGKTGKVFSDSHPYFKVSKLDQEAINQQSKNFHAAYTRERVRDWAGDNLTNGKWTQQLPGMPSAATITGGEVKTVTGKPHSDAPARNNLLYALALITNAVRFLGTATDKKEHPGVTRWYYYLFETINGKRFFLNFWERSDEDGTRIGLHAITDSNKAAQPP